MKLVKARIHEFKSIKDLTVHFKNNTTCIIGKNESGKSSIIEAIQYFNYYKLFDNNFKLKNKSSKKYNKELPAIHGTFKIYFVEIPREKVAPFINLFKESVAKTWDAFYAIKAPHLFYEILRWGDGVDNIEVKIQSEDKRFEFNIFDNLVDDKSKNKAIELFIEYFMPEIEFYTDEELKIKHAKVEDLTGDDPEFETLRRALKIGGCDDFSIFESDDYDLIVQMLGKVQDELTKLFQKHYNQDKSIRFELTYPKNRIVLQIFDATNSRYSIEERSPGFRYFFAFLINKYYLTNNSSKSIIFLLDEPGANLYPHGCKSLLKTFEEFSVNNEIIYTTHNVFLTLRNDLDSLLFTHKDNDEGTIIEKKSYKNKYQIFRKELGILLNDSFLIGNLNIVVEGDTEHFVLRHLVSELASKNEKYSSLEWLNIYDAGGVDEVQHAIRYLNSLGDELCGVILLDSDPAGDRVFKKSNFITLIDNKRWICLRINDIFQDSNIRTFEDLFPQKNYISAYNKHYGDGTYDFDIPFTKLDENKSLQTSIVDAIEETHYLQLFEEKNRKKKSISKINILRVLLEDAKLSPERDLILANTYKLIEKLNEKVIQINNGYNHKT